MDSPPHYDTPVDDPPPYQTTSSPPQQRQHRRLSTEQHATLILDGCTISSQKDPTRVLYETNSPPCEARTTLFGLQKHVYSELGDGRTRSRLVHLYDFTYELLGAGINRNVEIKGKAGTARSFADVKMVQGGPLGGTASVRVAGHFRAGLSSLTSPRGDISWKAEEGSSSDGDGGGGRLLAVETRGERNGDDEGGFAVPPRLVVKVEMAERDLDLLVTCWCARLWKEAEKELAEPFSWGKCKCLFPPLPPLTLVFLHCLISFGFPASLVEVILTSSSSSSSSSCKQSRELLLPRRACLQARQKPGDSCKPL